MNSFFTFINSSVGKKLLMSLTGLFLSLFLIVHLAGNLLVLRQDGGESFNTYAHFMGGNPLVRTLEIGLFLFIAVHIVNGVRIWWQNRKARGKRYDVYRLDENTTLPSRMMALSASLVLLFLVVHLRKFWVPARFEGEQNMAGLVVTTFQNGWYVLFYLIALVVLGYHLRHGFQSAFQTFGWKTKRYAGLIEFAAAFFWLVIPVLFACIPLYVYLTGGAAVASLR
ncbi:MAG: succinate dehydrogenase cytochrome b subunit [Bacteroidetes bacterium]|nr:MAG: succinate dehydrogenase cytochrome b subunit [Bacteroidota bacterium]